MAEFDVSETSAAGKRRGPDCIYFVHAPLGGRIKIGVAVDPERRFSHLQTGSPETLTLMGWVRYDATPAEVLSVERELHDCWGAWRSHGEWFEAVPDLIQFAEETRDPETAPERRAYPVIDPDAYVDPRRPTIPAGVAVPQGNTRKARMERYLLARGLTA